MTLSLFYERHTATGDQMLCHTATACAVIGYLKL